MMTTSNRISVVLVGLMVIILLISCRAKQTVVLSAPVQVRHQVEQEHSPNVFLVMYDTDVGKTSLLDAIKAYRCDVVYDYKIINGMALKKPDDKSLDETMRYFRGVKGVLSVEYDRINHLVEPVKPHLESK